MRVAPALLRQVGHEFGAQSLFDALDHVLLHRFHLQHAADAVERHVLGQDRQDAGRVLGPQLGQNHRDSLRIFVLEIVRQHFFLNVGELFPHVAAGGAADFIHDAADALLRQILLQQALGGVVVAEQRARGRQAADEFEQQLFDFLGLDAAELRHDDGNLAQLVVVEHAEYLAAVLVAERQHQHRRAFRAGELAPGLGHLRTAGEFGHQATNVLADFVDVGVFFCDRGH